MSVAAVHVRIAELDAMVAALARGPQAAPTSAAGPQVSGPTAGAPTFASALASASSASSAAPAAGGSPFGAEIDAAALRHGIDPALLRGLVRQESGFDPAARSPAGALGLTQLMPATARSLGVTNPLDPVQALEGGARYLRQQLDRFGGDERLALAAYNAGPGAVARFGGIPPYAETQTYVQRVLGYAGEYRGPSTPTAAPAGALPYSTT